MGEFHEVRKLPLGNATDEFQSQHFEMNRENTEVDDDFDDQFEEDLMDRKLLREYLHQQRNSNSVETDEKDKDELDLSSSRWTAYDVFARTLERLISREILEIFILIKRHF